jgi:hypothetical protein
MTALSFPPSVALVIEHFALPLSSVFTSSSLADSKCHS